MEDDFEDVEDQIKDTQKALKKYLLAFDEVYAIPEKYPGLAVPDIGKIDVPEIPEMMFEPEMEWPDWTEPAEIAIGELGDLFGGLFDNILDWLKTFFSDLWNIIKKFGILVKDQFQNVVQFVKDVVGATSTLVKESWRNAKYLGQVVAHFFKTLWQASTTLIKELWSAVKEFAKGIWGAFSQVFKDIWNAVKEFTTGIWDAITQLVKTLWDALLTFVKGFWVAIKELWRSLFSAESFSDAIEAIRTFFGTTGELFTEWFSTVKEALSAFTTTVIEVFSSLFVNLKEAFSNFFTSVKEAFSNFFTSVKEAFSTFGTTVKEAFNTLFEGIRAFFTISLGSWKKYLAAIGQAIIDFVNRGILNISRFFTANEEQAQYYAAKYQKMFWDLVKNITAPIREALNRVQQYLSDLGDRVKAKFGSVLMDIKNTIMSIISTIANAINSIINLINKIPRVNIPTIETGGITNKGIGIGTVPDMAQGGILNKEQIVRAAEAGKPEAYTPLTARALKPWADAIASALGSTGDGAQAPSIQEMSYIAVPIDNKGMVDLERQLFVVRKRENIRRSVGVT